MAEWFADDSFWSGLYPFIFSAERLESAADEVDGALLLLPNRGKDALDLCCGPGRHSVELASRGFRVTGVDSSSFLLNRARDSATRSGVEVEWIREDARRFTRPDGFDLAQNMFTSLGYFDDSADDVTVLRNVHTSLRPGGALLVELVGKETVADSFQPVTCEKAPDGSLLMQRHEIIEDWTRILNEWFLIRKGSVTTYRFTNRIYSGQELREKLAEAGFDTVRLYGDLEGHPYGLHSPRLVAVAVK